MYRRFRLIGQAVLIATLLGAAQGIRAQSIQEARPILWPDSPRPALTYSTRKVPFDGIDVIVGQVVGSGIRWDTQLPAAWRPSKDNAGRSLAFVPQNGLPVRLEISVFGLSEFLPDISEEVWQRYLAGLSPTHKGQCDILYQVSPLDPTAQWIPVLGSKTRTLAIRYPDAQDQWQVEIQLFAFCRDHLIVFVLSGPEKATLASAPAFHETLRHIIEQ